MQVKEKEFLIVNGDEEVQNVRQMEKQAHRQEEKQGSKLNQHELRLGSWCLAPLLGTGVTSNNYFCSEKLIVCIHNFTDAFPARKKWCMEIYKGGTVEANLRNSDHVTRRFSKWFRTTREPSTIPPKSNPISQNFFYTLDINVLSHATYQTFSRMLCIKRFAVEQQVGQVWLFHFKWIKC